MMLCGMHEELDKVFELYEAGDLTAEQAMMVIAIDTGRVPRSARSRELGQLIQSVSRGDLSVETLKFTLENERRDAST